LRLVFKLTEDDPEFRAPIPFHGDRPADLIHKHGHDLHPQGPGFPEIQVFREADASIPDHEEELLVFRLRQPDEEFSPAT